jgi:hypothetical protein
MKQQTKLPSAYIEEIAADEPERLFAWIPKSSNGANEWIRMSYAGLAEAASRMAWWLESVLGREKKNLNILYMGYV